MSTPVNRNPCLPRKYLSIEDAKEEPSETEATDILQKKIFCHSSPPTTIFNPSDDETATDDKAFISPTTSKRPKSIGSPHAENEESPHSAQTVAMFTSPQVEETESVKLLKAFKISDISADNPQKSSSPRQIAKSQQESGDLAEETKTSNLIKSVKHTPSPIIRQKISSNPAIDIRAFVSSPKRAETVVLPTQDTKVESFSVKDYKMNNSPVEWDKAIGTDEVKRKSPSPRRNKLCFRIIPRITCSDGMKEIDFELPLESEQNPTPTARSNFPICLRHDETTKSSTRENSSLEDNIKSVVLNESKVDISPKILESQFSPCETKTFDCLQSLAKTISPSGDKDYIPLKAILPSAVSLKAISSPKSIEHQVNPLKRKTTGSSHNLITAISRETGQDCIPSIGIWPSSRFSNAIISPKTMKCLLSPSE